MTAPALSLVAALDRDYAIGKANALPWHLPDDLRRFKALTLGKPVLMGRKTAESPGQRNLVLTRGDTVPFAGMEAMSSLQHALDAVAGADEVCVIGGGEIFGETLPMATRLHLTWVDTVVEGADAFFPRFDGAAWREVAREAHPADAKHAFAFAFVDYVRA